jgi:hypothetical protein
MIRHAIFTAAKAKEKEEAKLREGWAGLLDMCARHLCGF